MEFLRTPDERFDNLPDYPFEPQYAEIMGGAHTLCGSRAR